MKGKRDQIDLWCDQWAVTRRKILGIIDPNRLEPHERLGKLKSTLGVVKSDAEGAAHRTAGHDFPEVYLGTALLIHRGFCSMQDGTYRQVMDAHYVWRELPVKVKASYLGLGESRYWEIVGAVKGYIQGFVRAVNAPAAN